LVFHKDQEIREMTEKILTKITELIFSWLEPSTISMFLEDEIVRLQEVLEQLVLWAHEMMPNEA
jgi:hypothetical protein